MLVSLIGTKYSTNADKILDETKKLSFNINIDIILVSLITNWNQQYFARLVVMFGYLMY